MRHYVVASLLAGLAVLPGLAQAMDCKKASSSIEHLICADPRLVAADAAMGKAYSAALKTTNDEQIRTMLITSQRRWVAARDNRFGDLDNSVDGQTGEGYSKEDQRTIVLKAMQQRTRRLGDMSKATPKQPQLIQVALGERAFASHFTGGPFAGFDTSCDFLPQSGEYSYGCFGTRVYQNNARICSISQDWASGSVYETRAVADVVDGKAKLIATCKADQNDCSPGDSAWSGTLDTDTQHAYESRGTTALAKLDAEVDTEEGEWLQSCLTDPHFPAAGSAK